MDSQKHKKALTETRILLNSKSIILFFRVKNTKVEVRQNSFEFTEEKGSPHLDADEVDECEDQFDTPSPYNQSDNKDEIKASSPRKHPIFL